MLQFLHSVMIDVLANSFPIFTAIFLGKYFSHKNLVSKTAVDTVGVITFKLIGPFFIFNVLYNISFSTEKSYLLTSSLIMIFVLLFITYILGKYLFKLKNLQLGAVILCLISFGAGAVYPFVGVNFTESTFKDFVIVDMFSFFIYLLLASIISVYFGKNSKKVYSIVKSTLKDPFILTMIISVLINLINLEVPRAIIETSEFFSESFFLMASLFVGLTLKLPDIKLVFRLSQFYVLRVVVVIIIISILGFLYSLSKEQTYPLYLAFLSQYTVLAVVFSKEQNLDHELSSQLVLYSMIAQLIIYPIAIMFLKS